MVCLRYKITLLYYARPGIATRILLNVEIKAPAGRTAENEP